MAALSAQTKTIVSQALRLFLCLAYFIGFVTAIYLRTKQHQNFHYYYIDIFKIYN